MSDEFRKTYTLANDHNHRSIRLQRDFIDLCGGNLGQAVMLSQIIFWHGNDKHGNPRMKVVKNGHRWIAKTPKGWSEEIGLTESTARRSLIDLVKRNLVIKQVWKFNGDKCTHIRMNWDEFEKAIKALEATNAQQVSNASAQFGQMEMTKMGKSNNIEDSKDDFKDEKKKDSSHPEGVAINGEKPIETTNNAGAGAYTDTPKAGEPEMTDFEDSLPDEDPPDHTASTVTAVDVSEHAVTPEPTPVQDSDDDPPDEDPDPEPVNPSEDHTHMLACMVWCWANDNYSLMTQRLYFLQGKNTKGKSRWGGEYWEWRLTADNEDHPNNGPVSDAEIMAFGVWLRRKWPNGDDFKRYCPQKAETIHSNLELFRGDESYPALVERARKGLDTILDQELKGKGRDDRIAHLGAALSRPPHKERLPLIPAIMPASPDWVPPANREPVPEMTPEEMRAYVAKGIAESTDSIVSYSLPPD